MGLMVMRPRPLTASASSAVSATLRAPLPASSATVILASADASTSAFSASSLLFLPFFMRSILFSMMPRSASASSRLMTSMSSSGLTLPATWMMSSSSNVRTTCTIASVSRMLARNWLPSPSPLDAPRTRPAMSTNSNVVGMRSLEPEMLDRICRRGSGTVTMPVLGSMVQKGKLAAAALPFSTMALNRVDLPTLGRPTIPA
mmetsp:Transcript_10478/g.26022  ORF Transcript_10478/g.26022 Transcript_10478/m.26022 type:complete len:202 (-) Transcript_10478:146-751(-)